MKNWGFVFFFFYVDIVIMNGDLEIIADIFVHMWLNKKINVK